MPQYDLQEILRAGENSRIEFKSIAFHADSLAKEVVAFANMSGGEILIGVADDRTLEDADRSLEERVVNICRNNIHPSIIPEITTMVVDQKNILRVVVDQGLHKPYKVKSTNKFYIRAGSVSIEPSTEELARLFQEGRQLHYEIAPVFPFSTKDFDMLRFREYVENQRGLSMEEEDSRNLLYNLQCIDEHDRVSVLGALFFAFNPGRWLPHSGLDINCFAGTETSADLIDYRSENCTVVQCIAHALEFVRQHSVVRATFDRLNGHRLETPDYEPFVVREVVVNAFMHRDWSIIGQRVRVNMFVDRLEIFSPGKLPNTLNLTRALSGISYYRNPIMAQMLKDYKMADRVGRGLQAVMRHHRTHSLRLPDFAAGENFFLVTLWRNGGLTPDA